MKNSWFRWEREASVHLLFPTLEVFYQPLKKYSGVSAPTMVLVFKNGIVTWCIQDSQFIEYGKKLLKVYSEPLKEERMVKDIKGKLRVLKVIEGKVKDVDLTSLSNQKLVELHRKLYSAFLNYYTMGAIGTPLSFSAELLLKKKGLSDDVINRLTVPNKISYISQAEQYLLKTKDIQSFIKKYFWIDNNYSGAKVLTDNEVKNRLKRNLLKIPVNSKRHSELVSESGKEIPKRIRDDRESKRLLELLKNYALYKDNRKKEILIYLHYLDIILEEVSSRTGLNIEEIRASLPSELKDILSGKLSKKELQKRLKYCVIVWEKNKNKPLVLTNKPGQKWERQTLELPTTDEFIHGRVACQGKVTGRVRVLLKAQECDQMRDGEVLVTFMTSPDFMPATRRASAIVTNLGGVTSHAAIISRELNIPCIVGTKIATQVLKTGDLVEVDGDTGRIKKLIT